MLVQVAVDDALLERISVEELLPCGDLLGGASRDLAGRGRRPRPHRWGSHSAVRLEGSTRMEGPMVLTTYMDLKYSPFAPTGLLA